jgi:hypothetical protein
MKIAEANQTAKDQNQKGYKIFIEILHAIRLRETNLAKKGSCL